MGPLPWVWEVVFNDAQRVPQTVEKEPDRSYALFNGVLHITAGDISMTLSPDFQYTLLSHTKGLPSAERLIRAKSLCRKYGITRPEEIQEVAELAGIPGVG